MGDRARVRWYDIVGLLVLVAGTLFTGVGAVFSIGLSQWGREDCDTFHPCRPDWAADHGGALLFWALVVALVLFWLAVHWLRRGRRAAGWCAAFLAPLPTIVLLVCMVNLPK